MAGIVRKSLLGAAAYVFYSPPIVYVFHEKSKKNLTPGGSVKSSFLSLKMTICSIIIMIIMLKKSENVRLAVKVRLIPDIPLKMEI